MDNNRRSKRVASLIKETLSRALVREFQGTSDGLLTLTRIEMSADLQTAHVYLSFFGDVDVENTLSLLEKRKGFFRKSIASEVKLKYNPTLVFHRDPTPEYESRIDGLLEHLKDEKK
jgi:ribosome-binding factor A